MIEVIFLKQLLYLPNTNVGSLKRKLSKILEIPQHDFYLEKNGKRIALDSIIQDETIHVIPRLLGGKGGFGSMLRAIGAQIEKTTNREACRDLSGRRLRDINEEKRLKNWIAQQTERERETEDRKLKKLQKMCEQPKHEFKDEVYDKERSTLPEKVEDAVAQGLKAAGSGTKRIHADDNTKKKKAKKPKLWVDAELDDLSSSEEENSEESKSASSCINSEQDNSSDFIQKEAKIHNESSVSSNLSNDNEEPKIEFSNSNTCT